MTHSRIPVLAAMLLLATTVALHGGNAYAQLQRDEVESCPTGTLEPGARGTTLSLSGPCKVEAGTYKFKDVHILANGVLDFADATIDFWANNILIENGGTLSAGSPSAPIGTNGGLLTIHLWGADQTGQDPNKQGYGIACWSDTKGHCGVPDDIWNSNIDSMGMPLPVSKAQKISAFPDASSYPRYADSPLLADDYFYGYTPLSFDGAVDPADPAHGVGYFGYKVLAVSYGGSLQLFGKKGATYATAPCAAAPTTSGISWARLAVNADTKTTALTVDRPMSLKAGDQVIVTTTDYVPGHSEQLTVASDVACSTSIPFKETLAWSHNGTRYAIPKLPDYMTDMDATLTGQGAEVRAAVGVLTRSIRIVSAGDTMNDDFPAESTGYYFGGQVIARQGFKYFQVQGVEFAQLGQGGKIGHYPVHFHHARVTPTNTYLRDSSINESMTRWVVLHGTQQVELSRNVGWKSIGHGFYLEDGTEINNTLTANLGVFARAAVDNIQNPRKVPGILAAPDLHTTTGENEPFRSDYDRPTIFWIMNAWNDFKDNMAVGAGTCGVCYWLVPAANSGMSRDMKWSSYASIQSNNSRTSMAPLKSFIGNSCSTAMISFQTVGNTQACLGVGPGGGAASTIVLQPILNPLASNSTPLADALNYYPAIDLGGGHFPTTCTSEDCSVQPVRCGPGNAADCMVDVLDHYTTSFNWAGENFAAVWLRPLWYLVTDSVITDVQGAGLTIVTGGGYSASDVIPGHWALARKSFFVGNTQGASNPYASNGGPFNPNGLHCAINPGGDRPGNYCLSKDEGLAFQTENFNMNQRLFNVYDGPAFQESNAYLNITERKIDDCTPFNNVPAKVGGCTPNNLKPGQPTVSAWIAGSLLGLPKATGSDGKSYCYMPNAAIGWKQPNGFYYPPAFHSANLFFDNVDIRHFVIAPVFVEGTITPDFGAVADSYCNWGQDIFKGFAGNDRQTVLNDDDGTLTGYEDTTVINQDAFFAAPVDAYQCRSDKTSRTTPYQYVTTVIYPKCASDNPKTCAAAPVIGNPNWNNGDWNQSCTSEVCYGVPLWRQDKMPIADKGTEKSIRMMGQATGQRSTLTANNGTYYIDTAVSKNDQLKCSTGDPANNPCVINVFKENQTYYLFLIFAKATTTQKYRFYVGENSNFDFGSIHMIQADIGPNPPVWHDIGAIPNGRAHWVTGNQSSAKGVVEVDVNVADLPNAKNLFLQAAADKCQPASFCSWNGSACVDAAGTTGVCKWAEADQDCPAGGCFGISFTLPSGFAPRADGAADTARPKAACVPKSGPWNVTLKESPDNDCPVPKDLQPADFCSN